MINVDFILEDGTKKTVKVLPAANLLVASRDAGLSINAPCSGNGSCGKCLVEIKKGKIVRGNMNKLKKELEDQNYTLACETMVIEDTIVFVPEESIIKSASTAGDSASEGLTLEKKYYSVSHEFSKKHGYEKHIKKLELKLPLPDLDDNLSDLTRLKREIIRAKEADSVEISVRLLRKLPMLLRENNFEITVYYHELENSKIKIIHMAKPGDEKVYGVAIDIGTTSVAACLVDLKDDHIVGEVSSANAQSKYGADVINRIIFSTKKNGLEKLREAIVEENLNTLITSLIEENRIDPDNILLLTASANTTMSHLLLGIFPDNLRIEPYIPVFADTEDIRIDPVETGLKINPNGLVYLSPSVASYVGGDISAGAVTAGIRESEKNTILIDLGTNGEIVFGNEDFLMTCACSAGPAFEGGEISCGMRASQGAIEGITIKDKDSLPEMEIIDTEVPYGICGSGIIDLISELKRTRLIDARGRFRKEAESSRIIFDEYGLGRYVIAFREELDLDNDLYVTEIDIDNFIRAKAAVYSALYVLLDSLGYTLDMIDSIKVAGGIGNHINIKSAIDIGLFPDIPVEKYEFIGNSSLSGSYMSLVNKKAKEYIDDTALNMTYMELSIYPGYMEEFISACFLPHTDKHRFPSQS
ncbi:MAG: DUF4445 domain-containing protein [Eubacteriaceae bacterium]|nr:DUF4445 domain-containing protein [Eubacteriaceae bacterium]